MGIPFLSGDTMREIALGRRVERASATLPQTGHGHLFQIVGGRVLVTLVTGELVVATPSGTNNTKLTSYPTAGTSGDLCATADTASSEAGGHWGITGTVGDTLVVTTAFAIKAQTVPLIVPAGYIDLSCSASKTGAVAWQLYYVPVDEGAYVVAV